MGRELRYPNIVSNAFLHITLTRARSQHTAHVMYTTVVVVLDVAVMSNRKSAARRKPSELNTLRATVVETTSTNNTAALKC